MNTRATYYAIRHAHRVAAREAIHYGGTLGPVMAAASALRAFTGSWDLCRPAWEFGKPGTLGWPVRTKDGRIACRHQLVTNTCRAWMRDH